ncbi:hypothetical protein MHYP_G00294710 [Metynnis hypsauchen]
MCSIMAGLRGREADFKLVRAELCQIQLRSLKMERTARGQHAEMPRAASKGDTSDYHRKIKMPESRERAA